MPELPEVETVRRGLADRLISFVIADVEVCRERAIASPDGSRAFCEGLKGAEVGTWTRRGKYLMAELLPERGTWGVHLRMTGQFQWHSEPTEPCRHTRVRFWNSKDEELRFVDMRSFGEMWWVPPNEPIENVITGLKQLGPEPFSPDFDAHHLKRRLKGSTRPIKTALLDQSLVAGVGNIYADESLFAAGINPMTPAGQLSFDRLKTLHLCLVDVLQTSIGAGGTTFSDFRDLEGMNGNYGGQAWVYRRNGHACRRCGTILSRDKLSGRSTHWCSSCQA
ncbi:MAG: DNA-formamidopyrimidine glycosylase [Cyanobium sp. NAT70]|nr:DNA-formamidopyrimidine glycosylase [Cyanobium sp. NAT70]